MYCCIYTWPKQDGQKGKKSFDSAVEAVEFMTEGSRDRTDFITSKSTISIYNPKTGDYELISYAMLVRDSHIELRRTVAEEEDFIQEFDATGTKGSGV